MKTSTKVGKSLARLYCIIRFWNYLSLYDGKESMEVTCTRLVYGIWKIPHLLVDLFKP